MQNILVVDDDTDLLMILKMSLIKYGYQVNTLSDPSRVEEMILTVKPEIVILDINMGDWDGSRICKKLKETRAYRDLPIVLYSALASGSVAVKTCKADLFLQKPLTAQMLATHLACLHLV